MRLIGRRVCKLEQRFGTAGPNAEEQRVWALAEELRRRRAERLGEPFVARPWEDREPTRFTTISEAMRAARWPGGER